MSEQWIAVVKKETEETDTKPFANGSEPRTVKTVRTWYINKDYPDVIKLLEGLPEN